MEVMDCALVAIAMACVLVLLLLSKSVGMFFSAKNDYREASRLLLNAKLEFKQSVMVLEMAINDYRNAENELEKTKAAYGLLNKSSRKASRERGDNHDEV